MLMNSYIYAWKNKAQELYTKEQIETISTEEKYPFKLFEGTQVEKIKVKYPDKTIAFIFDAKYEIGVYSVFSLLLKIDNASVLIFTDLKEDNQYIETLRKLIVVNALDIELKVVPLSIFNFLEDEQTYFDKQEAKSWPMLIWYKLFLPYIVDAQKILYLDSDVVIIKSIDELFKIYFDNKIIAASGEYRPNYVNIGVCIFDTYNYKKNFTLDEMRSLVSYYIKNNFLFYPEQDFVSILFYDLSIMLPRKWNCIVWFLGIWDPGDVRFEAQRSFMNIDEAHIIHYAGSSSFWQVKTRDKFEDTFNYYVQRRDIYCNLKSLFQVFEESYKNSTEYYRSRIKGNYNVFRFNNTLKIDELPYEIEKQMVLNTSR